MDDRVYDEINRRFDRIEREFARVKTAVVSSASPLKVDYGAGENLPVTGLTDWTPVIGDRVNVFCWGGSRYATPYTASGDF